MTADTPCAVPGYCPTNKGLWIAVEEAPFLTKSPKGARRSEAATGVRGASLDPGHGPLQPLHALHLARPLRLADLRRGGDQGRQDVLDVVGDQVAERPVSEEP